MSAVIRPGAQAVTAASPGKDALTVSQRLAEHAIGTRFEDLPDTVVEHAKDLVVYDLACAFAGRFSTEGRQAVALAHRLSAGGDAATIVAHRERATLVDAIFAHTELMGEEADKHLAAKLLAGISIHPVAWVLGEHAHASGRELITALVVGYDAAVKLAEPVAMAGDYTRMPHKCAFAPFAAAAIAARLLRQDRSRAAETIARAAHLGMGNNEGYSDARVFGLIARNAVVEAMLPPLKWTETLRGVESPNGLYAMLFGGVPDRLAASLGTLGRDYAILGSNTQRYPGSASHVAALEAARELLAEVMPRGADVTSVVAVLPDEFRGRFGKAETVIDRAEPREADLISSLRLRLAILLVEGAIVRPTLAHLDDSDVGSVLAKISLAFERRPDDYARIEVRLADGRTLRREGATPPSTKGDWPALLRKDGQRFLSAARLAKLEALLTHLEEVEDVGDVLACTVPDVETASAGP